MTVGGLVALESVQPGPVAAAQTLVTDNFNRSVAAGFGSATSGGSYLTNPTAGLSVDGSRGLMALTASVSRTAKVGPTNASGVEALSSFGLSVLPTAGSTYFSHMLATNSAGAHYSPRVRVMPDRSLRIGIRHVAANGTATQLGTDVKPGFTAAASSRIMVRSAISGTTTATLRVKAWVQGTAEPANWTVTATSSALPATGQFGIWGYLNSGTPAAVVSVDDLTVTAAGGGTSSPSASPSTPSPKPTTSPTPTPTPTSTPTPTPTPTTSSPKPTTTPTQTSTPTPTQTTSGKPGAHNTGLPAGTALKVHNGDLTINTAGTVIDGMDIRGFVRVKAPNVTIRRSIVRGTSTTSVVGLLMLTGSNASGFLVEDVTLLPSNPSAHIDGIKVNQSGTIRRVNISKTVDGISIYGGSVRVESSFIHSLSHYTSGDPNQGGGASHDDAIQVLAGTGHRILNNTLQGAHNAAVMITQDIGVTKDLWINHNWIDGGGCSLNYGSKGAYKTGMQANHNRFGRNQRVSGCAIVHNAAVSDLNPTGNVWDDSGQPATIKRGT